MVPRVGFDVSMAPLNTNQMKHRSGIVYKNLVRMNTEEYIFSMSYSVIRILTR